MTAGDIELEMSAFTEEALEELLAKTQDGDVKEDNPDLTPPETPVSHQGDIWLLAGIGSSAETARKPIHTKN